MLRSLLTYLLTYFTKVFILYFCQMLGQNVVLTTISQQALAFAANFFAELFFKSFWISGYIPMLCSTIKILNIKNKKKISKPIEYYGIYLCVNFKFNSPKYFGFDLDSGLRRQYTHDAQVFTIQKKEENKTKFSWIFCIF